MRGNEYNDLWLIMNDLKHINKKLLPENYINFVISMMVPDAEANLDRDIPISEQQISPELRDLLATLTVTYLARNAYDRRDFVNTLHKNELKNNGLPEKEMTEEEYQDFLSVFDEWNDLFGPIPFWAKSRGWQPEICYELTDSENYDIKVGDVVLKEVYVTPEQRKQILNEARQWILVGNSEEDRELYWHDNDYSSWTSTREIEDYYKNYVVVKDGHFTGALIDTLHHWGAGMAEYKDNEYGILFTDGTHVGRIDDYYSRSSDESSASETTVYSLKRK